MRRTALLLVTMAAVALAACSSDGGGDAVTSTEAAATTDTPVVVTDPPATTDVPDATLPPATTESAVVTVGEWTSIPGGEDCVCSDGSPFELWNRPADPSRVVLFLAGGGACFNELTCGEALSVFTRNLDLGEAPGSSGIFDPTNEANPVAEHSVVYVPYCSGDVHLGDNTVDYGDVTIEHNGFANASKGLETVLANYPDVEQLVVIGASAGSIPAPAFAGLAADALPDAEIVVFGDSSGAYPDAPELNVEIGGTWGVLENVPDWPVNDDLDPADWSIPGLTVQSATQHPDITFARFDYDTDVVQAGFLGLAGIPAESLLANIDATEAQIESVGVDVASFVAPGGEHTIVGSPEFYDLEVDGVRLLDFFTTLINGGVPADVTCAECIRPG